MKKLVIFTFFFLLPTFLLVSRISAQESSIGIPEVLSPNEGQYFNSTPILNDWTDVNATYGVAYYRIEYEYDDGHDFTEKPYRTSTISQRNHSPGTWEEGGVKFRVQAFDNQGNEGNWSDWRHYYYLSTPPTVQLLSPVDNFYTKLTTIQQTWKSENKHVDYYSYRSCSNNPNTDPSCNLIYATNLFVPWRTVNNTNIVFWWQVRATDKAGNIGPWSSARKITMDNQAPSIPTNLRWENPNVKCGGRTNSYSITAAWDISTDNLSGVKHYIYHVDTPKAKGWTTPRTTTLYPGHFNQGTGDYTFKVKAVDYAGNESIWSNSCTITYYENPTADTMILGTNRHQWNGSKWETLVPKGRGGEIAESDFTIEQTYGYNCTQILEAMEAATGESFGGHYKFGCSKSVIEAWIDGKYFIEQVEVDSKQILGAYSEVNLLENQKYLLTASGTWQNSNLNTLDAECRLNTGSTVWELSAPRSLRLQVDESYFTWGNECSPDNTYTAEYTGTGDPVWFRIVDGNPPVPGWYNDNVGSLLVDIYAKLHSYN